MVYFDDDVQRSLREAESSEIDPKTYTTVKKSLVNMILSGDYISGVYILDKGGHLYSSYTNAPKKVNVDKIKETNWYKTLPSYKGNGHFMYKTEGVIEYYNKTRYITYVREIRDTNNYKPLAILMVTMNEDTIQEYFDEVSGTSDDTFYIVNEHGKIVASSRKASGAMKKFAENKAGGDHSKSKYVINKFDDQKYMWIDHKMDIPGWKLVGAFDIGKTGALTPYYTSIVILLVIINVAFLFMCSIMLTRMIFHPLQKIEKHMLMVENGQFVEMPADDTQNEIDNLRRVYNQMIHAISDLINEVKEEEKEVARIELDMIQAQINPHFLYNTMDAISALSLTGDNENCFRMTQALGNFYRNSLNSGKNFVTVQDEIECVKSYLTILNIRYNNKIKAIYEIEPGIEHCKMLKLLIQPLVENAVYHGIKRRSEGGTIRIQVFSNDDEINILVNDDGDGIGEEQIEKILGQTENTDKSGFGIHSLIQRIRLYYGIDQPVMIHSETGIGTEIAVRIKRICNEPQGGAYAR
jgi:two-component system sensor histidine kinase YesM